MSLSWRDDQAQDLLLSQMCKHETQLTKTMHCILISSQCNFPIAMIKKNTVEETYKWKHLIETYSSREIAVHHLLGREHCSKQAGRCDPDGATERSHSTPQTGISALGMAGDFWNLKLTPKRHTSPNKVIISLPKELHKLGTKYSNIWAHESYLNWNRHTQAGDKW